MLDDVRDLAFLSAHQEKIQGRYRPRIEFAATPGGTCAYSKDLHRIPIVVTCNLSTENLGFLTTHDFLKEEKNRVVVKYPPAVAESA